MDRVPLFRTLLAALLFLGGPLSAEAGMPAILPTPWTAESGSPGRAPLAGRSAGGEAQWQALSFFLAGLFAAPVGFCSLWNVFRRDFPKLPKLRYRQALVLIVLWGLAFVVVLTMISGARELMTPGAWKKQGWTYKLTGTSAEAPNPEEVRRRGLESLRFALWQYAIGHDGQFPAADDNSISPALWSVPANPGLKFLYRPNRSTAGPPKILVFEPDIAPEARLVLFTSGMIGMMRTEDLERQLLEEEKR